MANEFNIERFLDHSAAVRVEPEELGALAETGMTVAEAKILRYMGDTERHTILYMRDLLAGHSAEDPEITAFLSVWVYEELYHGRAIEQMLAAAGHPLTADHYRVVTKGVSIKEPIEAFLSHAVARATPRFIAVHTAWGALNELTAAAAYLMLAGRTQRPALAAVLKRIAKQERKHFSFYFQQSRKRLVGEPRTQALVRFAIRRFWTIVGMGVGGDDGLGFVAATLFSDEEGISALRRAEDTIRELPGLEWFDMLTREVAARARRYRAAHEVPADPFGRPPLRNGFRALPGSELHAQDLLGVPRAAEGH